jgi:D-alanyl-D-alanine endopeptidase (penicillin-binding protein 7)
MTLRLRQLLLPGLVLMLASQLDPADRMRASGDGGATAKTGFTVSSRPPSTPALPPLHLDPGRLRLRSSCAVILDQEKGAVLYAKNATTPAPIASLTKLMTAMVILDSSLPMDEPITIREEDVDTLRHSRSHLPVGWTLPRGELLQLALMSSENRAANALARTYPGGSAAFVQAMNRKAQALELAHTHFADPAGLHSENVSTAQDLARLVREAYRYAPIRRMTTTDQVQVRSLRSGSTRFFGNSNALVRDPRWEIGLSKTGYIADSGFCLAMQATISGRPILVVLLDAGEKLSRIGDANRIRTWIEAAAQMAWSGHRHSPGHAGA